MTSSTNVQENEGTDLRSSRGTMPQVSGKSDFLDILVEYDDQFYLNKAGLEEFFKTRRQKKPVAFIGTVGAQRLGKSFLMNLIMKHLKEPNKRLCGDSKIRGFPWRGGTTLCTPGVILLKEPILETETHDTFLIDTKGLFAAPEHLDQRMVAFISMICTILIVNVKTSIQEHDIRIMEDVAGRLQKIANRKKDAASEDEPKKEDVRKAKATSSTNDQSKGGNNSGTKAIFYAIRNANTGETHQLEGKFLARESYAPIKAMFPRQTLFTIPYPGKTFLKNTQKDENVAKDIDDDFIKAFKLLADDLLKMLLQEKYLIFNPKEWMYNVSDLAKHLHFGILTRDIRNSIENPGKVENPESAEERPQSAEERLILKPEERLGSGYRRGSGIKDVLVASESEISKLLVKQMGRFVEEFYSLVENEGLASSKKMVPEMFEKIASESGVSRELIKERRKLLEKNLSKKNQSKNVTGN